MTFANCTFDALSRTIRATVIKYMRFTVQDRQQRKETGEDPTGCAAEQCAVVVRNHGRAAGGRYRVMVRALILGIRDWRTRWINTYGTGAMHLQEMRL